MENRIVFKTKEINVPSSYCFEDYYMCILWFVLTCISAFFTLGYIFIIEPSFINIIRADFFKIIDFPLILLAIVLFFVSFIKFISKLINESHRISEVHSWKKAKPCVTVTEDRIFGRYFEWNYTTTSSTVFDFDIRLDEITKLESDSALYNPLVIYFEDKIIKLSYGDKHHLDEKRYYDDAKRTAKWNKPHIDAYFRLCKAYVYIIQQSKVTNKAALLRRIEEKTGTLESFGDWIKTYASTIKTFMKSSQADAARSAEALRARDRLVNDIADKVIDEIKKS